MFSRGFKKSGVEHLSTYLKMYKIGDIVDVKGDYLLNLISQHKSYYINQSEKLADHPHR